MIGKRHARHQHNTQPEQRQRLKPVRAVSAAYFDMPRCSRPEGRGFTTSPATSTSRQTCSHPQQEAEGAAPAESKMRNLPPEELLKQLPPLQRLLERLIDTLPRGAAARHYVVQAALLTVAKESFQVCALSLRSSVHLMVGSIVQPGRSRCHCPSWPAAHPRLSHRCREDVGQGGQY